VRDPDGGGDRCQSDVVDHRKVVAPSEVPLQYRPNEHPKIDSILR
jgi:hypothetical protein